LVNLPSRRASISLHAWQKKRRAGKGSTFSCPRYLRGHSRLKPGRSAVAAAAGAGRGRCPFCPRPASRAAGWQCRSSCRCRPLRRPPSRRRTDERLVSLPAAQSDGGGDQGLPAFQRLPPRRRDQRAVVSFRVILQDRTYFRWRILLRILRFLRPTLRRPLPRRLPAISNLK